MNVGYILAAIIVGFGIGASVFFIQNIDLTGRVISTDASDTLTEESTSGQETLSAETNKCPSSCDDNNPCTVDWCNETSSYSCSHLPINGTAEGCWGSPTSCSTNTCISGKCTEIVAKTCCGNSICDSSESCNSCALDCGECPAPIAPTQTTQSSETTQTTSSNTSTQQTTNQTNTGTNQTNTTNQTTTSLSHVIINEFTTRGPNGSYDEFAELYNPTNSDVDITGWKLQYKSATGETWQSKVGSGTTGTIKSKSFFLLVSKGYSLSVIADYNHSANWGLSDTGGHLRIIDANGNVVDKVGWGDANEPEGTAAPALEDGKSLERKSLTTDTNNNANDFILAASSPKNSS